MPDQFCTTLMYNDNYTIVGGTSPTGVQRFRGNSCFDPDHTGVGGQPMGFDELTNFYGYYRVRKSTVVMSLVSSSIACRITLTPTVSLVPNSVANAMECPYTRIVDVSSSVANFSCETSMSTYKLLGVPKVAFRNDPELSAVVTANPVNTWYWTVLAISNDGTTNLTLRLELGIEYEVEFYGRVTLSRS